MKRIISLILVIVAIVSAVNAVADTEALFSAEIPVSRQGLYRVDPDDPAVSKAGQVTVQESVAQYAKDGWVVGAKSASDLLNISMLSKVGVWGFKVLDTQNWPEEAKSLDGQELVTWLIDQVTRLVYEDQEVFVCLNVEPFKEGTHVAQAEIQLGSKESQYWTIFRRTDGIWTLCTVTGSAKVAQGGQPTAVPQDPGHDPEPTVTPVPTAVPQDPGRDGDDNGDGGEDNPIEPTAVPTAIPVAIPQDPGRDCDDNGDGGEENPLLPKGGAPAAPSDPGRD